MITASSRLKRYSLFKLANSLIVWFAHKSAYLLRTVLRLGRKPRLSCPSLFGFRNKPAGGLLNLTLGMLQQGVAVYFMLYVNEYDSGITNGTVLQNDTRSQTRCDDRARPD